MLPKLGQQFAYSAQSRPKAEKLLERWRCWAIRSEVKLEGTAKEHWQGILGYFDLRLPNGYLEGINSLIPAAKAKSRGYRNSDNLIAGKLKFPQQA